MERASADSNQQVSHWFLTGMPDANGFNVQYWQLLQSSVIMPVLLMIQLPDNFSKDTQQVNGLFPNWLNSYKQQLRSQL